MAWRLSYFLAMGAIMVFVVAPYVVDARPVFECPSGMVHVKEDDGTSRCCYDITCLPGFEPEVCSMDNPTSNCIACSNGTFQPTSSRLSHPQWMKCRQKTNCNGLGTKYRNMGNTSIDSTCECTPGYFCDDSQCLPKGRCRVGYGRDAETGNCLPCALGETYSDVEDISEPCKKVKRCESSNLCTLKPATVQHDSVCGNFTSECGLEEENPIPPVKDIITVMTDRPRNPLNGTPKNTGDPVLTPTLLGTISSDNHVSEQHEMTRTYVISMGCVSVFAIVGVLVGVLKCKAMKKEHQKQLQRRLGLVAIKRLDPRYSNKENQQADFGIFKDTLEKTCASYAALGKELLGETKLKDIEADCKDKNYRSIDMVHEILTEWQEEKGLTMLPDLYGALKRAKLYEALCLIEEKLIGVSNESNDSAAPLMEQEGRISSFCHSTTIAVC